MTLFSQLLSCFSSHRTDLSNKPSSRTSSMFVSTSLSLSLLPFLSRFVNAHLSLLQPWSFSVFFNLRLGHQCASRYFRRRPSYVSRSEIWSEVSSPALVCLQCCILRRVQPSVASSPVRSYPYSFRTLQLPVEAKWKKGSRNWMMSTLTGFAICV